MELCENQNLRIFIIWVSKFERIYKFVETKCIQGENEKYFDEIYRQFMIYSIRVVCAIGKNKPLYIWKMDEMVADSVRLEDMVWMQPRGFRFIDEFYKYSNFIEGYGYKAVNYIIDQQKEWEEEQKKYSIGKAFSKLNEWYYLEDEELQEYLKQLVNEIGEKKYVIQNYQNILSLLVYLKELKLFVQEEDIISIKGKMINIIEHVSEKITIDQIGSGFTEQNLVNEYNKYWNEVLGAINKKNKSFADEEIQSKLDFEKEEWSEEFINYCRDNKNRFLQEKKFLGYFDETLLRKIADAKSKEIYNIQTAILVVYCMENISDFFKDDKKSLENLVNGLEKMQRTGKIKQIAVDALRNTLEKKLEKL